MGQPENTILCVGLVCIDEILTVENYPDEDSSTRVLAKRRARGGNASNNCTVLAVLGARCEFMGKVGTKDPDNMKFIISDFERYGISHGNLCMSAEHEAPISVCIVGLEKHSRTIFHYRGGLPELTFEDFQAKRLDFSKYTWVHFEGRYSEPDTLKQLAAVDEYNRSCLGPRIRTSVELEKRRASLELCLGAADYVFVSKEFAKLMGYSDMCAAVQGFSRFLRAGAAVICAWGERGAAAQEALRTEYVMSAAFPPPAVVDTLGAGDTFVAATAFALSRELNLQAAITFGCQVAGAKCGTAGFDGIASIAALPDGRSVKD